MNAENKEYVCILPVDEMLSELRAVLEHFDREPSYALLDRVYQETNRIADTCEKALEE